MSVFRTLFLADSFGVRLSDGSQVDITHAGTNVPDQYDAEVRAAAAKFGVALLEGGPVVPGTTALAQRLDNIETEIGLRTRILDEITVRTLAYTAVSGQMVPVDTTGRSTPLVITLPPGGTGTRVGVRLDAGPQPVTLAGTGQDSVPATTIAAVGTVVILEGIRGGGGWRVTSRFAPDQAVDWSQIQNKPTIPTSLTQLSGSVTDAQIPSAITRDTELADTVNAAVSALLGGAPTNRNTLAKIATALAATDTAAGTLGDRVTDMESRAFARYHCAVSGGQNISATGTPQNIPFDVALSTHGDVTQNGFTTFTLNRAGVWSIQAGLRNQTTVAFSHNFMIWNGSTSTVRYAESGGPSGSATSWNVSCTRRFAAGAVVAAALAISTTGTNDKVATDVPEATFISLTWLRS